MGGSRFSLRVARSNAALVEGPEQSLVGRAACGEVSISCSCIVEMMPGCPLWIDDGIKGCIVGELRTQQVREAVRAVFALDMEEHDISARAKFGALSLSPERCFSTCHTGKPFAPAKELVSADTSDGSASPDSSSSYLHSSSWSSHNVLIATLHTSQVGMRREVLLVLELDGQRRGQRSRNEQGSRTRCFGSSGYHVIRCWSTHTSLRP
jgi:hypothetical protein